MIYSRGANLHQKVEKVENVEKRNVKPNLFFLIYYIMKNGAAFTLGIISGVALVLVVEKITDNNDNKNINGRDIDPNKVVFSDDQTTLVSYPSDNEIPGYPSDNEIPDYLPDSTYTIPDGVTNINNHTFSKYTSLKTINIPSSVTSIDDGAFSGCRSLTSITVDKNNNNYISVNGVLFNKDKTLLLLYPCAKNDTSYEISDSVTSIGNLAFNGCTLLKTITIPATLKRIGDNAFGNCSSLKTINIPSSVTSIGDYAFFGCTLLETVTISTDSQLTTIGNAAFYQCKSLTTITIPSAVTTIGYSAFSQCSSLETVTISTDSQLTTIGSSAFSGCSSLVPFDISDVKYVGNDVFKGCKSPSKGGKRGKGGKNRC
jgi:hypothetical protein